MSEAATTAASSSDSEPRWRRMQATSVLAPQQSRHESAVRGEVQGYQRERKKERKKGRKITHMVLLQPEEGTHKPRTLEARGRPRDEKKGKKIKKTEQLLKLLNLQLLKHIREVNLKRPLLHRPD